MTQQMKLPENQPAATRQRIVDSREPDIIRTKLLELGWEQEQLYSADYWFWGHGFKKVGITRKRTDDLMNSLGEHFSKQLEEMLDYYDINIILVEGSWHQIFNSINYFREVEREDRCMVLNWLHRWQQKGFIFEITSSEGNTVKRLNELYALHQKDYSMSSRTREFTDDRVLAFPAGSRGKTAMTVLDKFKTLQAVSMASVGELKAVDGIGDKKAQSIFNHFRRC
jgi:ERCC4-type nuclease